jgi:hypothetical protein
MKNVFLSKSRRLIKAANKESAKTEAVFSKDNPIQVGMTVKNDFIAWLGKDFPKQDFYGFKNLDAAKSDLSFLINAKLLVIIHTLYTQRVSAAVNFAFEYGIPILWINDTFPPKSKAWFFDAVSKNICWELICQLTK